MRQPAVSVVVPLYNAEEYISTCVKSLLSQSFDDIEILVVDDGSTDRGVESLGDLVNDYRLRVFSQENSGGPAKPRNVGIAEARGEFVFFFDADDVADKTKIERTVEAFESAGPAFGMAATDFRLVDDSGNVLESSYLRNFDKIAEMMDDAGRNPILSLDSAAAYDLLLKGNFVGTSSVAVRKSVLADCGGFDETLANGDDYDFWLRIVRHYGLLLLGTCTHSYRKQSQSISHRPATRLAPSRIAVLERQTRHDLTPIQKSTVNRQIASNYHAMGWEAKSTGKYADSVGYYWSALRYRRNYHLLTRFAWSVFLSAANWFRPTQK